MALVQQNLRGQILGSPTQGVCSGLHQLGEAEVGEFEIAILSDKQVLWLEVPEDDVPVVEMFEDEDNLSRIQAEWQKADLAW